MADFGGLKASLGNLVGSEDIAGFILFGVLTIGILVAFLIATSKSKHQVNSEGLFIVSGVMGIVLGVGFEWLPLWAALIFGMGLVVLVLFTLGRRGG